MQFAIINLFIHVTLNNMLKDLPFTHSLCYKSHQHASLLGVCYLINAPADKQTNSADEIQITESRIAHQLAKTESVIVVFNAFSDMLYIIYCRMRGERSVRYTMTSHTRRVTSTVRAVAHATRRRCLHV